MPSYATPSPYGYAAPTKRAIDPVSIIGFVFSLTCCLSFVGVVLGFVGLRRTRPAGRLRGRWAAISSLAIGIPFTLLFAGFIVFAVLDDSVYVDDLHTGDCFDATGFADAGATLDDIELRSCTERHEAEVLTRVRLDGIQADLVGTLGKDETCVAILGNDDVDLLAAVEATTGAAKVGITESDDVDAGDLLLCVTYAEGDPFEESFRSP